MHVLFSNETGNVPQIVYYQSGVGSESDFLGSINTTTKEVVQRLGRCVASKIRDAYSFLAQNFEVGDEIFLFGFSRGAYIARKLAELIDCIGLLTTENLGLFFNIWKDLSDGVSPVIPSGTMCWFPGAHSDIGGSYSRHEHADISLFWMAGEIKNLFLFDLDYDFIERSKQPSPRNDWGSSKPHNAYEETPRWMKTSQLIHAQNRLESGDITNRINYHLSWKYALDRPSDPYNMDLNIRGLNDYEKGCKDRWNDKTNGSPVIYGDVSLLFPSSIDWASSTSVASMSSYQQVGGGSEATGSALYVGRASFQGGIHPGKVDVSNSCIYIGWGGNERKLTDFDNLIEKQDEDSVGWYRVVGALTPDVLGGITPVPAGQESDGTTLYSARATMAAGCLAERSRWESLRSFHMVGTSSRSTLQILVFKSELYFFHNAIGQYETKNIWTAVKRAQSIQRSSPSCRPKRHLHVSS
ncbi:hypothetical protein BJV77DRAFT_1068454 [Russula vinacea]|nr:hypothetical protein BJV77DRAFT_1068454 [Russula vinacea]